MKHLSNLSLTTKLCLLLPFFIPHLISAQNTSNKAPNVTWKPVVALQIWNSYTTNELLFDPTSKTYLPVDDRFNFQLRRSRFGVKGTVGSRVKYNLTGAFDLVGRDLLAATQGGANNGASPIFRLWNAYAQYKVLPKQDGLHLTFGYFVPSIGRESITPALVVSSLEKSWSQNYLRRHLVGIGPGRVMGMNAGGFFGKPEAAFHLSYDLGMFTPVWLQYQQGFSGQRSQPLLVGRVAFHFGDPEFEKYTTSHKINYQGDRRGITLAVAVARQGKSDFFTQNTAFGIDCLFNWDQLNISGDWTLLGRQGEAANQTENLLQSEAQTGFIRMSYNLITPAKKTIEPTIMWTFFRGALDQSEQAAAAQLRAFAGGDYSYELGFNYHYSSHMKLSVFHTHNEGNSGDFGPGADFNNYFRQGGVGAIERGDWWGLGMILVL